MRPHQVSANLRSALWRARREAGEEIVHNTGNRIGLHQSIHVDLHHWAHKAREVLSNSLAKPPEDIEKLLSALSQHLLPSWDEQWLTLEQQRWNELRLHALELLAERLGGIGRHVEAVETGLEAVSIEPYRESANRALMAAYLSEGNYASAVAQYSKYRRLLLREVGLHPTQKMQAFVQRIMGN